MGKARNGIRYDAAVKSRAVSLRCNGRTHREIRKELGISMGTAWLWLKDVKITSQQKQSIEMRRNVRRWNRAERLLLGERLRPFQFTTKYTNEDLLHKIRLFYEKHGRIPLKKEFNALRIYRERFGSWNTAIKRAGFDTNPVLFAKRHVARDGHICDSLTEKIIDDWLSEHAIPHKRNARYGSAKLNADFLLRDNVIVEFFGLAGVQSKYDKIIEKKRMLAMRLGMRLLEIYPDDIYPKNKLRLLLKSVLSQRG